MRKISNRSGSDSDSQTQWQNGYITNTFAREGYETLIERANSVSLKKIFKIYGIHLDEINKKTTCPFKSHKGGREHTASFYFYPETNSYCCFGCRQGARPVDFVSYIENISRNKAAEKILQNFQKDVVENLNINCDNFNERLKILMEFSNIVRDFRIQYNDEKSFDFIESKCNDFDKINEKYDLKNQALKLVVSKLIEKINDYKG